MPATATQPSRRDPTKALLLAQAIGFLVALALVVPVEWRRVELARQTQAGIVAWVLEIDPDTTIPFLLLLVAPVLWWVRRSPESASPDLPSNVGGGWRPRQERADGRAWLLALGCAATAVFASGWVAAHPVGDPPQRFGDLPPAYHDEFSYQFQAETFLKGRISYPSNPRMPELFDQMHVVNEGRFASRYFPGVGLWIAPFLASGNAYRGQWLANALSAFFIFWAGRELAGNGVGAVAGWLTALSPGMALFSNLLLSHEPTMAALAVFLFAMLRFARTASAGCALVAGVALSVAMLCRPMTAAGFALPFGVWFVYWLVTGNRHESATSSTRWASPRQRLICFCALGAPLLAGLLGLFLYNREITGNGLVSPYQLYTDTYTPRHVYGFNNVVRGERQLGPKVIDNYDRWAENLTISLAADNVAKRISASFRWTLSLVPVTLSVVVFYLAVVWQVERRWLLVGASVLSLHAVHVPYWFAGIMNWHYVFETGPLLLLIVAIVTRHLIGFWRQTGKWLLPSWWALLLALSVVMNWIPFDPFWSDSRIDVGVEEIAFARLRYDAFDRMLEQAVSDRPALVLVDADPADRSLDYVYNTPDLTGPILRGRYRPGKTDLAKVAAAFPERAVYLFDVRAGRLRRLSGRS